MTYKLIQNGRYVIDSVVDKLRTDQRIITHITLITADGFNATVAMPFGKKYMEWIKEHYEIKKYEKLDDGTTLVHIGEEIYEEDTI